MGVVKYTLQNLVTLWFEVNDIVVKSKGTVVPVQVWIGPEVPRFQENRHMKPVRLSALYTGRIYS